MCVRVRACVFVRARACESVNASLCMYSYLHQVLASQSFLSSALTRITFSSPPHSPHALASQSFLSSALTRITYSSPPHSPHHNHQSMRRVGLACRKTSFFFDTRQADALTKRIGNLHREVEGHEFDDGARSRHGCQFAIQSSGIREYQNPLLFAHGAGSAK